MRDGEAGHDPVRKTDDGSYPGTWGQAASGIGRGYKKTEFQRTALEWDKKRTLTRRKNGGMAFRPRRSADVLGKTLIRRSGSFPGTRLALRCVSQSGLRRGKNGLGEWKAVLHHFGKDLLL